MFLLQNEANSKQKCPRLKKKAIKINSKKKAPILIVRVLLHLIGTSVQEMNTHTDTRSHLHQHYFVRDPIDSTLVNLSRLRWKYGSQHAAIGTQVAGVEELAPGQSS